MLNCATLGLLALTACLGDPDPSVRDKIAFERFSTAFRGGAVSLETLTAVRNQLLRMMSLPDPLGFQRPFVILTLAEVARTDRLKPWMTDADRDTLVTTASQYLASITDYRAFDDREGFRHGVAHAADLAMQLALNPATTRIQLDRLLAAVARQVSPQADVAYYAGEPDRLARPVMFIAQRKLHTDAEWKTWFESVMNQAPMKAWSSAFESEQGIKRHHNTRAFLLSVYATAATTEDAGIKLLLAPVRDALKLVP